MIADERHIAAPLAQRLRVATAVQHARVEARLSERAEPWTKEGYPRFLQITLAVIASVEPALVDQLGPLLAAPVPLTRVERLRRDLAELGQAPSLDAASLPIRSAPEAWGVGYVVEGSLLGGAVIVRRLSASFAPASAPAAYLTMHGGHLGRHWTGFRDAVNQFGATAGDAACREAIAAAARAFDAFETAIDAV